MNHFRIAAGRFAEFERLWRERDSHLEGVPGFLRFHLVRGKDEEDGTHRYATHTEWADHDAFLGWTHSDAFRKAHGGSGPPQGLMLEHPRFRGWQAIEL